MKELSAVKFRIILSVLLIMAIALIAGTFAFGYKYLQGVGQDAAKRQADATASEDSISNLQRLQAELNTKTDVIESLRGLRSANTLPQFGTEKSLRTITSQLGLPIKNVTFINDSSPATNQATNSSTASSGGAPNTNAPSSQPKTSTGAWGSRNSRISFEFSRSLSYDELVRFYDAIETSTPKLRLNGLTIPASSSRGSISPGTLTLELATT